MAGAEPELSRRAGSAAQLPADLRAAWIAHGDHAHALNALLGEQVWRGPDGAVVPYRDTGTAWVAAGTPIAAATAAHDAAVAFASAARAAGRIPLWFGIEHPERIPDAAGIVVGSLPEWSPAGWAEILRTRRRIREQLRRARKKGVTIRALSFAALAPADRYALERLESAWARTRRIEPMGFVVAHRQDNLPLLRRCWIAEVGDRAVAYVTATPMPARHAWLVEDLRRDGAPNGTSELMFDTIVRTLAA
ncbi:MAG TPA: phosphatidylglycerol lysyltransferase domain-containing protein, partial [Gemmatimonadaceae bacterium]|nr:phosphatidylglycerol lysyltransferase domain-containing protein [Gemmatimonadaceae bacterium]